MSASDAAPLPRLGEVFFDVRGDSRSMRLSWYADTGVAVFSVWSGGRCTGTFRLPIDDLPRMIEILQRGPERRRRPAPDSGRGERADRGRPRNEPGYYGEGDYSDGDDSDGIFGDGGSHDGGSHDGGSHDGGSHDGGSHDGGGHDGGSHDGGGHDDARYEPGANDNRAYEQGAYDLGAYGQGGYDQRADDLPAHDLPAHDRGGYDQGGYDQGGYSDAAYGPADHGQSGPRRDGYAADGYGAERQVPDGYGADRYGTDAHRPDGYGADAYGPDGYGADDRVSASRRPDGGHRAAGAAVPAGYPDVPGYSGATFAEAPRPGASRSDVPTGSNWRPPDEYQQAEYQTDGYQSDEYHADGYQPGEYHADGYQPATHQGDGYQPREHQADGYQTAAYPLGPADHSAGAQSDLAGYGQERFVPPYVQGRTDAYPNDNPGPGRARRRGGTGQAYPADHGGVSDEPHPYARSPRSGPGYFEGSEDRLAADTHVSARYSAGGRGN